MEEEVTSAPRCPSSDADVCMPATGRTRCVSSGWVRAVRSPQPGGRLRDLDGATLPPSLPSNQPTSSSAHQPTGRSDVVCTCYMCVLFPKDDIGRTGHPAAPDGGAQGPSVLLSI